MNKKTIETAIKWLIYGTFFVPLIVVPSSFIFPFIVPKIIVLRSLILLMVALYTLLLLINFQEYKPKFTALSIAVSGFLLSFALSTFFGADVYHSFWDNHERMLGLFTIIHYIIYFFITSQIFRTWAEWKTAMSVFLFAGSLVMLVGVFQIFNPNFLLNQGASRIISTLGNAIYVGGYGLFLFFTALVLFLKERTGLLRGFYAVAGFLALVGLFYSGTRGTLLGLIVGLGTALLAYIFVLKEYPKTRNAFIGIVVTGVILLVIIFANRNTPFVKNLPAIGRLLSTPVSEITSGPRIVAWGVAINGWKERPILGWGPNNFFYAFNANYDPRSLNFGYGETWFDNAHNIIVNTLAVQGIVGLITYLAIYPAAIYLLLRAYREKRVDMHLFIFGGAFLVAHLVQNVTVFENPTSYLYFMFWLGMINSLTYKPAEITDDPKERFVYADKKISTVSVSLVMLTAFFLLFVLNIQPARANMRSLIALQRVSMDPGTAMPAVKEALSFNSPHIDDIRSDISRTIIGVVSDPNRKIDAAKKKELFDIARQELIKDIELHPLDIRIHLSLSQLYQTEALQNNDLLAMVQAEKYLEDALEVSPRRQQIIYNLAILKLQLGKNEEAFKLLQDAINDNPTIAESYLRLAYAYNVLGQKDKAMATIQLAKNNNVAFSEEDMKTIERISSTKP